MHKPIADAMRDTFWRIPAAFCLSPPRRRNVVDELVSGSSGSLSSAAKDTDTESG
jgi:hypothetical protein